MIQPPVGAPQSKAVVDTSDAIGRMSERDDMSWRVAWRVAWLGVVAGLELTGEVFHRSGVCQKWWQ